MGGAARQLALRDLHRHARADDAGHVFDAGAASAFLIAAVQEGVQARAAMAI